MDLYANRYIPHDNIHEFNTWLQRLQRPIDTTYKSVKPQVYVVTRFDCTRYMRMPVYM